jgi:FAD/FMN-containing dehydrogenase
MTSTLRNAPAALNPADALAARLPAGVVLADAASLRLYAQDVFTVGPAATAVLSPRSVEELQACVATAAALELAIVPRGGGMSYTSGYVPDEAGAAILDVSRLDRVVEVNEADMTVTVEAGCTWKTLYETLKPRGLRTPFWGSLSGLYATVGGGMSQNAVFWGAGLHGSAAESAIGFEVVLADGSLIRTGARAADAAGAFFRNYGPDLTGLFAADAGALGVKARITLKLRPEARSLAFHSFAFETADALLDASAALARAGLGCEIFGFDPKLQRQRMKRDSLSSDVKKLANVMKAAGSVAGALKDAAKITLAGRSFLDDVAYSLHVILEGRSEASVAADSADAVKLAIQHGGRAVDNSIPKIMRANPFGPVNSMLGPQGERWVPIHGLAPHSRAKACLADCEAVFEAAADEMEQLGVTSGYLFATVAGGGLIIEPVFFWPDALDDIHERYVEPQHLAKLPRHAPNPPARALVERLRAEIIQVFQKHGVAHLQIGRTYPYLASLDSNAARVLQAVKTAVDPTRQINPGGLGL